MARVPALGMVAKTVINGPITFALDANPLVGPAHGIKNGWLLTGSSMGRKAVAGNFAHWMTLIVHLQWMHWLLIVGVLDPANRSYREEKAIECLACNGIHYPFEERPAGRNLRLSPLHNRIAERGAVMGFAHGCVNRTGLN